jgi:serine/threonine-protein kinase
MILHGVGRDTEARLQLRESLRLREALPGRHAGLVGDTLRLLGEANAGLGEHATAERQLRQAVSLTRQGYGPSHPHTLRSELSLAGLQARDGSAAAMRELKRLASLSAKDIERRRVAWLASAYLAERNCHGPQHSEVLQNLAALDLTLQQAQPEGGAVVREIDAIRAGCQSTVENPG